MFPGWGEFPRFAFPGGPDEYMLGRPEERVQLAVKIAIWMLFVLVVAQLYTGATRLQREALIVEAELQRDHRILASTIVAVLDAGSGPRPSENQISTLLKSLEDAEHEGASRSCSIARSMASSSRRLRSRPGPSPSC